MPKINSSGIKITLKNKDNTSVAQVLLPIFCLEHMKRGSETDNLNMMLKHLSSAAKFPVQRLFLNEKPVLGLSWSQCAQDIEFQFE